jgi:tetratricopeptide (TPR) repeat protein
MSPFDPTIDTSFLEYADLQLRRQGLLMHAKEQEPEFDQIEDRMTELWEKFDAIQRQSVNGMASDLNWIRRKGQPPPKGRKADEVTASERQELLAARVSKEWHRFLHYMRICASVIPAVNLAYLRGNAYDAIGFHTYAAAFYEFAAELAPSNSSMGVIALRSVDRVDPEKALRRAEQVIASPLQFPPVVVALSAVMVLRRDEEGDRPIDRDRYSSILKDALSRLSLEPPSDAGHAMSYQLAASGFEILDDLPAALQCYEDGLKLSPDNEVLLIGKGLLLYGSQTERAVEAFQRVVSNQGSSLVWPYFFLAHYYLLHQNYSESLKMGKQARARAKTNPIRAELFQWQAICLSESGYPPDVVRPLFEKALSLDPSNERIRRNSEAFENSQAEERDTFWDIEAEETLRTERAPRMSELELAA